MTLDPRTPVLVGAGQVSQPPVPAPEPVALLAEAARLAAEDAGAPGIVRALDSVQVVNLLSHPYGDPAALVAEIIGAAPRQRVATTVGGNTPQVLVNRAAADIAAGRLDTVLVGGAESWRTRAWYKKQGQRPPWTEQSGSARPTLVVGEDLVLASEEELAIGMLMPVTYYPMFETALLLDAAAHGISPAAHLGAAADLWARFSEVAASNPYAAIRQPASASAIATPAPDNRVIGWPYTKRMCSNNAVDQAAAVLVCSVAAARAAGVPEERWVFVHGGAHAGDVPDVIRRPRLGASPAIRTVVAETLALAGAGLDDVGVIDLYSCFPSAVQVAAAEIGLALDDPRGLTVTGGLTFAGGPWNNYVTHSIATMLDRLRRAPGTLGLITANGGNLTKHAAALYSTGPPPTLPAFGHPQRQVDQAGTAPVAPADWTGPARLEAWTVMHDRSGNPEVAYAYASTAEGARVVGASRDPAVMTHLESDEVIGTPLRWVGAGRFALG